MIVFRIMAVFIREAANKIFLMAVPLRQGGGVKHRPLREKEFFLFKLRFKIFIQFFTGIRFSDPDTDPGF